MKLTGRKRVQVGSGSNGEAMEDSGSETRGLSVTQLKGANRASAQNGATGVWSLYFLLKGKRGLSVSVNDRLRPAERTNLMDTQIKDRKY